MDGKAMSKQRRYYGCFAVGCGTTTVLLLFIVGIFLSWTGKERLWHLSSPPSYGQLVERLGGERVAAILSKPDRVGAVLVDLPNSPIEPQRGYLLPHEYQVVSVDMNVPEAVAADISRTLLTPELHRIIDGVPDCIVRYGVRVTYFAGPNRVDLYLCFTCSDLAVYLDGKPVGDMKFIFVERELLSDVRQIFPENKELRELEAIFARSNR
jgi:hypothetical protein